jgi:hypothetical protein
VKSGVIDPTKVTRSALQNAASISALMLTTEAMICEIPEKKNSCITLAIFFLTTDFDFGSEPEDDFLFVAVFFVVAICFQPGISTLILLVEWRVSNFSFVSTE